MKRSSKLFTTHTFAVELAAKLLENGISTPDQLLTRLQVEKASFHNEDKIKIIKDGQSSKATYYSHIHTLFSLYTLSLKQQDILCNMCFLPSTWYFCPYICQMAGIAHTK
ncbi:MAG: hypothetical protein ACLROG_09350 [Coprococcus phoceensis]